MVSGINAARTVYKLTPRHNNFHHNNPNIILPPLWVRNNNLNRQNYSKWQRKLHGESMARFLRLSVGPHRYWRIFSKETSLSGFPQSKKKLLETKQKLKLKVDIYRMDQIATQWRQPDIRRTARQCVCIQKAGPSVRSNMIYKAILIWWFQNKKSKT